MPYGYMGNIARIDLTQKTVEIEHPPESFYKRFLGGRNMAGYFMLTEIPKDADPLGPENVFIATTSVLTGTPVPGSSRHTVAAKSPLTGGYGESEGGGFWGPELKRAGYDAVIVKGVSATPVYLLIVDDDVQILDAAGIWGTQTHEAQEIIRKEHDDPRIRVLQTGIAGENLVRFAAITNELKHWNGRNGIGAVMGSKKLRAIAVRGTKNVDMKNRSEVLSYTKWYAANWEQAGGMKGFAELGTSAGVQPLDGMGILPTSNYRKGSFSEAESISGEWMRDNVLVKREGCFGCPVRCKRVVKVDEPGLSVDEQYGGPEYETACMLGSNCEVGDFKTVSKANELCGRFGIDTISTGNTIAVAMECFEKGLISKDDTDGIDLTFGNGAAVLELIEKIAKRDGFGDKLAEGGWRFAQRIGNGAEKFVMGVKKQGFPAHEPRGKWNVGLGYAVSPTGADHLVAAHDPYFEGDPDTESELADMDIYPLREFGIREPQPSTSLNHEKVRIFVHTQYLWSLYDVLDLCKFMGVPERRMMSIEHIVKLINDITGWDMGYWEVVKMGEKGVTMARLFNTKHGFTAADDVLPDRMFEPLENGALQGTSIDKEQFNGALKLYYQMMGWSDIGVPTLGKLVELGVGDLAEHATIE